MAIYRNLRENYEYRLRYDEAGEFFIREMELKRKLHTLQPYYVSSKLSSTAYTKNLEEIEISCHRLKTR
jgi:hypothetical protein